MTATPLMDPNLSRVTELLMNIIVEEKPVVTAPLMRETNVSNKNHTIGLLEGKYTQTMD